MKKTIIISIVILVVTSLSVYNFFAIRALKNRVMVHESVLQQIVNLINSSQSNQNK